MMGLPRLLILFAVASTLGAILAKYWVLDLLYRCPAPSRAQ